MALIFKQSIMTNTSEVQALYEGIAQYIFRPFRRDEKISAAEFLATDTLRKVGTRLHKKYVFEKANYKARQFSFTFSPQEIVAILICIGRFKPNPFLDVVLGKLHQRSLNLGNIIELNPKSPKQ